MGTGDPKNTVDWDEVAKLRQQISEQRNGAFVGNNDPDLETLIPHQWETVSFEVQNQTQSPSQKGIVQGA